MSKDASLDQLERTLATDPGNAELHHLFGAALAQAGDYARAERELIRSLELNPQGHVARFQLGLLHLTNAQPQRAIQTWAALESLPDGAALKLFKRGLEALIQDRFADCARLLQKGIAANSGNPALSEDMRLILKRLPQGTAPSPARAAPEIETPTVRIDFSLYTNTRH
jgi:tetratricopeptide (TPR) repeat protein